MTNSCQIRVLTLPQAVMATINNAPRSQGFWGSVGTVVFPIAAAPLTSALQLVPLFLVTRNETTLKLQDKGLERKPFFDYVLDYVPHSIKSSFSNGKINKKNNLLRKNINKNIFNIFINRSKNSINSLYESPSVSIYAEAGGFAFNASEAFWRIFSRQENTNFLAGSSLTFASFVFGGINQTSNKLKQLINEV